MSVTSELTELLKKAQKLMEDEMGCSVEEVIKEETGLTEKEFYNLDEDEFDEISNKVIKRLRAEKKKKLKESLEEDVNGTMFKVYDAGEKNKKSRGVCIEAQGSFGEVIFYASKGLGEFLKGNKHKIKSVDGLCKEIVNLIKETLEEEE